MGLRQPFDKLRANGSVPAQDPEFPFGLSLSKPSHASRDNA